MWINIWYVIINKCYEENEAGSEPSSDLEERAVSNKGQNRSLHNRDM